MRHAMIDLETLSLRPSAYILTIAARLFDPTTGEGGESLVVHVASDQPGRHIDPETVRWWMTQEAAARSEAWSNDAAYINYALLSLYDFLKDVRRVWCKGPSFDAVILEHAYRAQHLQCPWLFHQVRDVRTVVDLAGVKVERTNTAHVALADVDYQIEQVCEAYRVLGVQAAD